MSPMQKAAVYNSGNSLHTSIESIEKDVLEEAEEVLGLGDKGDPNTTHEGRTDSDSAKTSPMRVPEPASRAPSNSSIPFIRGLSQSLLTAQKGASSRNVERARSGKVLVGPAQMQDIVLGEVNRLQVFQVHTEQDGYNFGRTYIFQAETVEESDEWQRVIKNAWHAAVVEASNLSRFGALRLRVEIFSGSNIFQGMMALLIVGNFIINVIQAELKYEPGSYWDTLLAQIEIVLTVVFIVELGLNLFANWFSRFVNDGWSVFDFIVVSLSVISLIMDDASDVNVLRLLRPLRVVRLLGRLRSLRLIINACTRSLIPVSNAFLVTFLITAIYSILGVSFFDRLAPEFFGRFSLALFTMFQIATGDAWASEVSRVMMRRKEMCLVQIEQGMFEDELECWIESWDKEGTAWSQNDSTELVTRGNIDPIIVLFFSSFVIVVGLTLLNVVVAVLLDNFTAATETEKEDMQQKSINEQAKPLVEHPLDPLLAKLVLHDSSEELSSGIAVLFRTFDTSLNGTISREELSEGLRKLKTEQTIHLSEGDFESMTVGLLDDEGELEAVAFELMLRRELSNFIQRHMARQIELSGFHGRQDPTVLFALKKLMLSVDEKLYKTVTKVTTLAHAGDMESYKKSLPMSMPQPWKEEVGGSMVSKVASLEERTRRIEDALRLQTGHMEALMRKLDVPLPNNQKRRFIGESPNARAASLPTPSDSSPRMEPLRGDLEVAVGEPANEPGWKESLKTAKLSTNDSEKDVTANGGTSANGVGK
uniref:EF-hand domain-containing protein n=1 Tax=Hemiselmis andersenii TaxID=464988 RepID=A0A6U4UL80_HEMAN